MSFTIKIGGGDEEERKPISPFAQAIGGMMEHGPMDDFPPQGPDPAIQSVAEDILAAMKGGGSHALSAALQRFADILEAKLG